MDFEKERSIGCSLSWQHSRTGGWVVNMLILLHLSQGRARADNADTTTGSHLFRQHFTSFEVKWGSHPIWLCFLRPLLWPFFFFGFNHEDSIYWALPYFLAYAFATRVRLRRLRLWLHAHFSYFSRPGRSKWARRSARLKQLAKTHLRELKQFDGFKLISKDDCGCLEVATKVSLLSPCFDPLSRKTYA